MVTNKHHQREQSVPGPLLVDDIWRLFPLGQGRGWIAAAGAH
jgi:hypothetical protein